MNYSKASVVITKWLRENILTYLIAVAAVVIALAVRWLLDPVLGTGYKFTTLFGAVAVAVWFGGWRVAVFSAVIGYLCGDYLFLNSRIAFGRADVAGIVAYVFSASLIIWLGSAMRTARHRAAALTKQAQEREAFITAILESIRDCFYTVDGQWRFTYLNAAAERYFGVRKELLLGKSRWEALPSKGQGPLYEGLQRAMRERMPLHAEGRSALTGHWLDLHVYPSLGGLSVFFVDAEDRKEMDLKIRALNENLEQRVAERTAELDKSHRELQALNAARELVLEEERKRIARELHDDLGQRLTVLSMQLHSLTKELPTGHAELIRRAEGMKSTLKDTVSAVRQTAANLRPVALDELGLVAAVKELVEDFSQKTHVEAQFSVQPLDLSVDNRLAMPLYRMVQESLTNVARHAEASEVMVLLHNDSSDNIILNIKDNGKGMPDDYQYRNQSFGLIGMRERATTLGGAMQIRSQPGAGTFIKIAIPRNGGQALASA